VVLSELSEKRCKPCEGGVEPLTQAQARELLASLDAGWSLSADGKFIVREFRFPAYGRTMAFANAVAWVATTEGHHPDLRIGYGSCEVRYTTTAIDGLSDNDFICAAKIDWLARNA
jgi:4a-hydroxytetrahydrobiopterin dehydratase